MCSCSSDSGPLSSTIEVVMNNDCDDNKTWLHVENRGGTKPYIVQIQHSTDKHIVHTIETNENDLVIELEDLNNIYYKMTVFDDFLDEVSQEFAVKPEGTTIIADNLEIEDNGQLSAMEGVTVNLYKIDNDHQLHSSAITDANGYYSFENLVTGMYYVEISIHEKYKDYRLQSDPSVNERIRVISGRNATAPFNLSCRINSKLDLQFSKF